MSTDRKIENARLNMKIAVAIDDRSAAEISLLAGLSQNVLGKYMRKETMINFGNMQSVCTVLGIPLSLITSDQQISPARIRLHQILDRMSDADVADFLKQHEG